MTDLKLLPESTFPRDFLWGVATSAYQIEGAVSEDGRGESIWDRYCRTPGKILGGDTGDVACDHYHRWPEDLALMKELGVGAYRFSFAWPRILPTGRGAPNAKGLDFYDRLIDAMLEAKLAPTATLNHWDLPQVLQESGGWPARDTADRFVEYAQVLFERFADRVHLWITHNEPWILAGLGYLRGVHAPGVSGDLRAMLATSHHLLLSHGRAVQALRAVRRDARIGIALNMCTTYPRTPSELDRVAARLSEAYTNLWYSDPLFRGSYPADLHLHYAALVGKLDFIREGDLAEIRQPVDFLGINYYRRRIVEGAPGHDLGWRVVDQSPGVPLNDEGWEINPEGLVELLFQLTGRYGAIPIYLTENGTTLHDEVGADGRVHDARRVEYLKAHILAARQAIARGVNLKGYFAWSLLDNFEWALGYSCRFGLVYTDYATQKRIPKDSFAFYQRVIRENGVLR